MSCSLKSCKNINQNQTNYFILLWSANYIHNSRNMLDKAVGPGSSVEDLHSIMRQ
jgi:hypothetical protein